MRYLIYAASVLLIVLAPFIGFDGLLGAKGFNEQEIFLLKELRIPRVLLSFMVGSILATSGWSYQILFKNPLASPYTLGVSSVAALAFAISELLNVSNSSLFVLLYGAVALILVYLAKKNIARERLLLFGVCLGIFSSSAIVFIQTMFGNESIAKLIRWMMGSVDIIDYKSLIGLAIFYLVFHMIFTIYKKKLTIMSISDQFAAHRGIDTSFISSVAIALTSLAIGLVIFFCGPIGFVGLIIPHITRRLFNSDFSKNFFVNSLLGGGFLVFCDLISRSILTDHIIPIGAITAVIGAPFLVFYLIKN